MSKHIQEGDYAQLSTVSATRAWGNATTQIVTGSQTTQFDSLLGAGTTGFFTVAEGAGSALSAEVAKSGSPTAAPALIFYTYNGTKVSPTGLVNGDALANFYTTGMSSDGTNGLLLGQYAGFQALVNGTVTSTLIPIQFLISSSNDLDLQAPHIDLQSTDVKVNSAYKLPSADGTAGQAIVTNGSGTASYQSVPVITSGTTAPASTPSKVGNIYVDTTNKKLYFATGATNSSDWTIAN